LDRFVEKLILHENGIVLLFNRCNCRLFQDLLFKNAQGILFIKGRVKFYTQDGKQGGTPGCGSVLVSFGKENAEILKHSGIQGKYFEI
jgi:hypothetical protein